MTDTTESEQTSAEQIAYVPREAIAEDPWLQRGFHPDPDAEMYAELLNAVCVGPRPTLERDPTSKQLIPYVVITDTDGARILTLRRKTAQSEERLHDNWSIGVGGHISPEEDASDEENELIRAGMQRELHEELHAPDDIGISYCGLLNDDSNDVGRVHLGLVYSGRANPDAIAIKEVEKMEGTWMTLSELESNAEKLESWSSLLLEPMRAGRLAPEIHASSAT